MAKRGVPVRAAVLGLLAASVAFVSGCGHPVTSVYVTNDDDMRYYVTFIHGPEAADRTEAFVNQSGRGVLYQASGEVSGTVELLRADCSIAQTIEISNERTLLTIRDGTLHAEIDADLSALPPDTLRTRADCLGG